MTHRRAEFSAQTKREAFERSEGVCECHRIPALGRPQGCGVALRPGHINYEHILQCEIRNDNSLENCAVLSRNCWRQKTDTIDLPTIAKSNRIRDRARGIYKPRTIRGWRSFKGEPVFASRER